MITPFDPTQVRLHKATPAHASWAAQMIHSTDPELFEAMHAGQLERMDAHLAAQWQAPDGLFSHRWAALAMLNDEPLGLMIGHTAETYRSEAVPFGQHAVAVLGESGFAAMGEAFSRLRYLLPVVPQGSWYLQNLAVSPAAQGRGLGERLLHEAVNQARVAGCQQLHLDVYAGNPAERLYARMGFRVLVRTEVPALEAQGLGLHLRMMRELD
jgi:ribosomal protein S18 acetylase RimI-like enzyme